MNFSDFIAAGGHGFYLWGSYGLALVLLCGELFALRTRRRNTIKTLQQLFSNKQHKKT